MSTDKSKSLKFYVLLALILMLLAAGIIFIIPFLKKNSAENVIKQKTETNLCLLTHDYVYSVSFSVNEQNTLIYLVKNKNNQFDVWEVDSTVQSANRLYAAALIVDSTGTCITSKYATQPWKNEADIRALKALFAKELDISPDNITVDGLSIRLTVKPVTQIAHGSAVEIVCINYNHPQVANFNISIIGPKERNGALPFKKIKFGVKDNEACYLLDFPKIDFSYNLPINPQVTKLKSTHPDSEGFQFEKKGQNFFEGAPVFNSKGELVGVHTKVNLMRTPVLVSDNFISNAPNFDTDTIGNKIRIDTPDQQKQSTDNLEAVTKEGITVKLPQTWVFIEPIESAVFSLKSTVSGSTAICDIFQNKLSEEITSYQNAVKKRDVLLEMFPLEFININIFPAKIGNNEAHGFYMFHSSRDAEAYITTVKEKYDLTLNFKKLQIEKDQQAMNDLLQAVQF